MNITIVGAGNIGTQFAVHCAEKNHKVIMYGSRPDEISQRLEIVNEHDEVIRSAYIAGTTSDARVAFSNADLIFVTMPAYCMREIAERIQPYVNSGQCICLVPGTGGGECAFKGCIEKGATLFGLQRVPSVARLVEYGRRVRAVGYREELFVASLPNNTEKPCAEWISSIFDIKCSVMPNYLNLTLTPSNPVLHTTRLRNLFGDYVAGKVYEKVPLFYEDWNDDTSRLLFKCDQEVQNICQAFDEFDLRYVKSLRIHYESSTPEALTRKITSIVGFKGLKSPVIEVNGGYVPDLTSRYFMADFPYGLSILVQIAELMNVPHFNLKETLKWYHELPHNSLEFRFEDYGIRTKEQLLNFYAM